MLEFKIVDGMAMSVAQQDDSLLSRGSGVRVPAGAPSPLKWWCSSVG